MQTTLLGLAIALILALVTALVGPHFVNWADHRAQFEAEASKLVGLDVRVTGSIDVRLLPVPWVRLGQIEIGPQDGSGRLRARSLGVALELGPLMRGEIRASEMRLAGPEFAVGIDGKGRVQAPAISLSAGDAVAIERLTIEDGRITLNDARSDASMVLENVQFSGEVRSLLGPVRGEGAFLSRGSLYGYRLAVGRLAEDGLRLRLVLDTPDEPFTLSTEGQLAFEEGAPRYDGSISVARTVDPEHPEITEGQEPLRIAGKVALSDTRAVFQDIEFRYGPDESALTLTGVAELQLGREPRLSGALSARQLDLDRLIAKSAETSRPPLSALETFSEMFGETLRPPVPTNVAISIDSLTVGGAVLHQIGADLRSATSGWQLDRLEFRAPGFTQVKLSGRLQARDSLGFAGAANIDSSDPRALLAWLSGSEAGATRIQPWSISGEVTLDQSGVSIERLRTALDRDAVGGRLAYRWASAKRPARLEADLKAGEIDVDAVLAFAKSAFSESGLDAPREVRLALEAERVRVAGFDALKVRARGTLDDSGIAIERLSVADFGDAAFEARGRIETGAQRGGVLAVDLDASDMAGVIALADRFAPALAAPLRRLSGGRGAKIEASVSLEQESDERAIGRLAMAGRIGTVGIDVTGVAEGKPQAFALNDLSALKGTQVRFDGALTAKTAAGLLSLAGLDRIAAAATPSDAPAEADAAADKAATVAEMGTARLTFSLAGPADGDLAVEGRLAAESIIADAQGTARFPGAKPGVLAFKRLAGTLAGRRIDGQLTARFETPLRLDGRFAFDTIDVPAAIAAAAGMPAPADGGTIWTKEPFRRSLADLAGQITFSAPAASFAPDLPGRDLRGVARFGPMQITFEKVTAQVAGGRVSGRLELADGPDGLTVRLNTRLSAVDAAAVLGRGKDSSPISGRLSLQAEVEGSGLSPAAFIGSLSGQGKATLADGRIGGLNPQAFDALLSAVDGGVPTEAGRVREFMAAALANGSLPVKQASADLAIAAGQVRLANVTLSADGTDVDVSGLYDLASDTIDATLSLTGTADKATPGTAGLRPVVFVSLKGPAQAPERAVDATTLTGWLALRAVELQAKKLEEMEKKAREMERQRAEEDKRRAEERRKLEERLREEARRHAEEAQRREAQERREAEVRREAQERREAEVRRAEEEQRRAEEERRKVEERQSDERRRKESEASALVEPSLLPPPPPLPGSVVRRAPPLPPALTIPNAPQSHSDMRLPPPPGAFGKPLNLLGIQN